MTKKNTFGGKAAKSLYVPMSETEQEVISRLVESDDLVVNVAGWAIGVQPKVTFGDFRVSLAFRLDFDRPQVPHPNYYFDLELRTRGGLLLYKERQATMYGGKPIDIAAGMFLDLVWDIAVEQMDPKLIRMLKPKERGLTNRIGNMKLTPDQKKLLNKVRQGENSVRELNANLAAKATILADE